MAREDHTLTIEITLANHRATAGGMAAGRDEAAEGTTAHGERRETVAIS